MGVTLSVEAEPRGRRTDASSELVFLSVEAAGTTSYLITPISAILGSLKSGQGVGKGGEAAELQAGPLPAPWACQPLICSMFL